MAYFCRSEWFCLHPPKVPFKPLGLPISIHCKNPGLLSGAITPPLTYWPTAVINWYVKGAQSSGNYQIILNYFKLFFKNAVFSLNNEPAEFGEYGWPG